MVAVVEVETNATVPKLCENVPPDIVEDAPIESVPAVLVKVPPVRENGPLMVMFAEPPVNVPPAWLHPPEPTVMVSPAC